jgi:hypothetical protein
MDWNALLGGLIGAGIPAVLTYVGLHRARLASDAEAFGPAVLLLTRISPVSVTFNMGDAETEAAKWAELQHQLDTARERLLVVSAGNPRRRVRGLAQTAEVKLQAAFSTSMWEVQDRLRNRQTAEVLKAAQDAHAEATAVMQDLIAANFSWSLFTRRRRGPRAAIPATPDVESLPSPD